MQFIIHMFTTGNSLQATKQYFWMQA